MFDIGIQEIIVIVIVALLVFGPKRLPELSRTIGKGLSELKRAVEDTKYQVDRELREAELSETQRIFQTDSSVEKVPAESTEDQKTFQDSEKEEKIAETEETGTSDSHQNESETIYPDQKESVHGDNES